MNKKKMLVVYPFMMMGGSTTSLLSFLQNIDKEKFDIDLLLYRNAGPLINEIPEGVRLLPAVKKYKGRVGKLIEALIFLFSGNFLKAILKNRKLGKKGISSLILQECQVKLFSKKTTEHYDFAISFLEGWSNRYIAYSANADKKYAWVHSVFSKTTDDIQFEKRWISKVSKVVFVTEACRNEFIEHLPEFYDKTVIAENIIDSTVIKNRAKFIDSEDQSYKAFVNSSAFKIVTVCRITISTKGLDRITECAKKLKADGMDFLWYIIGDGADMPDFQKMINEAGIDDCLIPIGQRMNPYPFIEASDLMCMPSRYEGKPMVITESMILSVPPVVTRYLSAEDQIENGVDGIVIDNEDNSLYPCLSKLIVDKKMLQKLKVNLSNREYGNSSYMKHIEKELFS